jgi:cytochrome c-type biogenesis protein CcmH
MKRFAQIAALACAIVLFVGADNARFENLGSKIMCTCSCGQMLLKCNHVGCPNSEKMIRQLRTQVASTGDDEAVLNWFRKEWGVTAVVEPSQHGFELLAWVMPFAGLGLGILLLVMIVRKWRARHPIQQTAEVKLDPQLEAYRARAQKETEI